MLTKLYDAFMGNKRQTSAAILSIAQRGRASRGYGLPPEDVLRLCMSVISQARK